MLTITVDRRVLIWTAILLVNFLGYYACYKSGYKSATNDIIEYLNNRPSSSVES